MRSSAFTVTEVIVVIAIIALLMALSLPVSHSVQQHARTTACRANINNLLIALGTYDMENGTLPHGFVLGRRPPPPPGYPGHPAFDGPGWYWFNYLQTLTDETDRAPRILQCPAKNLQNAWLQRDILCGNYGINRSISRSDKDQAKYREAFGGPPLSTANIRRPGSTLLLVDSGYALTCWWQARDDPLMDHKGPTLEDTGYIPGMTINKERILEPGQYDDAILGRHLNERVNVGYVDGHAQPQTADDLLVEKTGEEQYSNRTPLWEVK